MFLLCSPRRSSVLEAQRRVQFCIPSQGPLIPWAWQGLRDVHINLGDNGPGMACTAHATQDLLVFCKNYRGLSCIVFQCARPGIHSLSRPFRTGNLTGVTPNGGTCLELADRCGYDANLRIWCLYGALVPTRRLQKKRHCSWRLRVLSSISQGFDGAIIRNKLGIWLNDDAADREDAHQSVDTCVRKARRRGPTMPFIKAHWRVHPGLCRTAILSVNQCMGLELRHPLLEEIHGLVQASGHTPVVPRLQLPRICSGAVRRH